MIHLSRSVYGAFLAFFAATALLCPQASFAVVIADSQLDWSATGTQGENDWTNGWRNFTADGVYRDPLKNLVYRVHPLPESMIDHVFDFGALSPETERLYIIPPTRGCRSPSSSRSSSPMAGPSASK